MKKFKRPLWIALALLASSCRPFSGNIVNKTGHEIQIEIEDTKGTVIAHGTIADGTALGLDSELAQLGSIRFRDLGRSCTLSRKRIIELHRQEQGIWVLDIEPCRN